ncbi:TIM21-domain-containing protein [Earliella scabrosa]|nr:TIM21-domain-containing protein [Earliella scabrosa]
MNLSRTRNLFHHARRLCRSTPPTYSISPRISVVVLPRPGCQSYATHADLKAGAGASGSKPTAQSLLSHALDQRQRAARREDSAGPFTLGITPPRPDEVKPEKKWSELSVGGKVVRTAGRTTNLVVILAGAGLSIVLIYALTSELFSRNSPTVLYNKACELIKTSPQVHQYLQDPLVFHNHPPSVSRPRHRNHYVSSQIFVDSTGREHMLLNFYVQGRPPGSTGPYYAPEEESGRLARLSRTVQETVHSLQEMSFDEVREEAAKRGQLFVDWTKGLFRFLTGEEVARSPSQPTPVQEHKPEKEEKGWMSSVTGMFSGIKGGSKSGGSSGETWNGSMFIEGEVHADLVMNDQGVYEFRYLLIDMPNSNTRNPRRVFIQRQNGVQETEPIVRWHR